MNTVIYESGLSGEKCVIYEVKHTTEEIQKAYATIFTHLQRNGYQIENNPIMERYTGDMMNNPYCEICAPVNS